MYVTIKEMDQVDARQALKRGASYPSVAKDMKDASILDAAHRVDQGKCVDQSHENPDGELNLRFATVLGRLFDPL